MVQKELNKGARTPEVSREWSVKKNDELVDVDQGLTDCELMKYSRHSKIRDRCRFRASISLYTTCVGFVSRYNGAKDDGGGFRDGFLS